MSIPVIDYNDPQVGHLVYNQLCERGFVFIKNHTLPDVLLQRAYEEWKSFFAQPLSMKNIYHYNQEKSGPKDGYFPLLTEKAKGNPQSDLKEFYHFYSWGRIPNSLAPITQNIHEHLLQIGLKAVGWLGKGLSQEKEGRESFNLMEMVDHTESTVTRALHYPAFTPEQMSVQLRSAAHEDINLLTVYPAATEEGLEFKDQAGQWYPVPYDPSIISIAIGDMLDMASSGRFKATRHRVVAPSLDKNCCRYAFLLFLHAKNYVQLSPEHTAASFLAQRYLENGVLKKRPPKVNINLMSDSHG